MVSPTQFPFFNSFFKSSKVRVVLTMIGNMSEKQPPQTWVEILFDDI